MGDVTGGLRIVVVGGGNIGRTLGAAWLRAGHEVVFGLRDPQGKTARALRDRLGEAVNIASIDQALAGAQVVVVAVPGEVVADIVRQHAADLEGKIVVDAANRSFGGPGPMHSLEEIGANAPNAFVVRAFNSLGWENFANPTFDGLQADLFYCSPAGQTQAVAERLIADVGLRPVRIGDLDRATLLDSLTLLWAALAMGQRRGRHLAFKLLEG